MSADLARSVLVVDDEAGMRLALQASLQRQGWQVETACGTVEALRKFETHRFPLVVTDVRMPDGDGFHVMRSVRMAAPETAVIILTAFGSVPDAVEAMRGGACDYLTKPISFEQLQGAVTRVMSQVGAAVKYERSSKLEIVGSSPLLMRTLERARHAARTAADILIEAESGTGKEVLARFVHENSERRDHPFIAVNCAALPEHLLESELFGHVRGAFTGASAAKPGKFELAQGGTLLLDEIGELPLSLQPKLLRVLQEREIERLGDTRALRINIRVIASKAKRDLRESGFHLCHPHEGSRSVESDVRRLRRSRPEAHASLAGPLRLSPGLFAGREVRHGRPHLVVRGLSGTLLMAVNSLLAQQGALQATTNNISNTNTPGYSREIANMTEATPTVEGNLVFGQGVTLQSITSVRNRLVEISMDGATQDQSSAQTQVTWLQQVQNLFSSTTSGIGVDLSKFFNSLNQLSTDPTNVPDRQAVLAAAGNLAGDFNSTASQLAGIRSNLNLSVSQSVDQINQITTQIAKLNMQVSSLQKLGTDPGSIEDERDQLETQLSQIAGVSITQTADGDSITLGNGAALVVGGQSYALQSSTDVNGDQQVFSAGQQITSDIQGGQLGGALQVRDQFLPSLNSELDDLAGGLAANFNAAHQHGFDLNGNPGQAFFNDNTGPGAAANFSVAITDASLIAASSDGSAGSNGNLVALQAVQTQALPGGQTPTDAYSDLTYNVGNATSQAQANESAAQLSLTQLTDQRQAISGVSIDEETTNLIRYQNAYSAAPRVITTIDELTQTLLGMATAVVS